MKIYKRKIELESKSQMDFMDVTAQVQEIIDNSGVREGMAMIFAPHTTMGVAINHNEPMLLQDLMRILYRMAPMDDRYAHDLFEIRKSNKSDGRSNGHSHCKSFLLGISETVPVEKGKLVLSAKQSIFVVDFDGARKRDVIVQVMGL